MSTFDGIIKEFPDIRIDHFRPSAEASPPPLAYFLSHVHTDHTAGLETCKSPFIYCSPATREILLRLQKSSHRMNFARGIVEKHEQHFKHLKKLLKPIPLETPATIELSPGKTIRVTLFDANHCVGAVCFLIEGGGKAVFYTGDIRAESWWVNTLCRHPLLVPYLPSTGLLRASLKRLDCVYLDTTFAGKEDVYKQFPSKASGIAELLHSVSLYPKGTLFYFDSWTFGYEDVWQALSAHLGCQIHVDDYRFGLYRALANGGEPKAPESTKLVGFHCGNHYQEGCLTSEQAQLHSCERNAGCEIWTKDFVRITPIISRHNSTEIREVGAGGGHGDLDTHNELVVGDAAALCQLIALCALRLQSQPQVLASVIELLTGFISKQISSVSLDGSGFVEECFKVVKGADFVTADELPLETLVPALAKLVSKAEQEKASPSVNIPKRVLKRPDGLAKQITFPYSRHSSYEELCDLIDAFKPKDIYPCTVDDAAWTTDHSMSFLFGHIYTSGHQFTHDHAMLSKMTRRGCRPSSKDTHRALAPASSEQAPQKVPQNTQRRNEDEHELARQSSEATGHRADKVVIQDQGSGKIWPQQRQPDHDSPDPRLRARRQSRLSSPDTSALEALRRGSLSSESTALAPRHAPKRPSSDVPTAERPEQRSKRRRVSGVKPLNDEVIQSPIDETSNPPTGPRAAVRLNVAEDRRLRLFLQNLPPRTTSTELMKFFSECQVTDAHVPLKSGRNGSSGCAFLTFATSAAMRRAESTLRGALFHGRRIRIEVAREDGKRSSRREDSGKIRMYEDEPPSVEKARITSRHEAHAAAQSEDSTQWSKLGLVSTGGGHQDREEEL
ncbi:hypothetical protein B0A54_03730 [Friedmanniomyces endolithicus]|uniref:Protein artemis n=1 Tax=Friedmanniomyces endolithicus TaxID=329885 RepID=A0A4U0VCU1_9PEZI|nr:hypothetical protein LTS09_015518 [Friedmanniomyces endolithicus]KAK0311846.1 hypothetical protein LTR01_002760 [Friedmanniomyces endolithicus]KAK0832079.1 hypothetical protein LTR73_002366 [Friedmanniomyces endolithicus]TKA46774.1 hypothetical protein B0A54_03730 [Friedmanniomyces endolithicus]